MNRLVLAAGLLALVPITSGCVAAAVGTVGTAAVVANQERTFGEAVDDVSQSSEIKVKLLGQRGLGEVDVKTNSGLVLLTGRVANPDLRIAAENIAWSSALTHDVANEVRIEAPGGFFANASDELISTRVRARLIGSRSVKSVNINVETYGGVVYLMGIARDEAELQRAAEEASYAGGVQRVVSYLRLRDARGDVVPYQPATPVSTQPLAIDTGPADELSGEWPDESQGDLFGGPGS